MRLPSGFRRLARREKCAVCGHAGWCLASNDGTERVLCQRIESSSRWADAGWLHGSTIGAPRSRTVTIDEALDFPAWTTLANDCRERLVERSEVRAMLADDLGVSVESMDALNVGLDKHGASTWPMREHLGRVIGIRCRSNGEKRAVPGSRNGLFLPSIEERELVLVTEGESDLAAALTLDFFGVGRPGCTGATRELVRWLRLRGGRDVVILADSDAPGIRGAGDLAQTLVPFARSVRVALPPWGAKDLRAALCAGATRADVLVAIKAASRIVPVIRRSVL